MITRPMILIGGTVVIGPYQDSSTFSPDKVWSAKEAGIRASEDSIPLTFDDPFDNGTS